MKKYLFISSIILLSACTSVPQKLQLPENTSTTSFSNSSEQLSSVIGTKARWGGVIAQVTNNANNTMVEIVNFPLSSSMRPQEGDESLGRFRVYFNGMLDPMIYKKGRSVTAIGNVAAIETGKIGEQAYKFPVLVDADVHLWKKKNPNNNQFINRPFWGFQSPFFMGMGVHPRWNFHNPFIVF